MPNAQDAARSAAIAEYGVLREAPGHALEGLTALAASVCGVPRAVLNIVDDRHQHQVAAVGFEPSVCAREDSMCDRVFQQPGQTVIADARADPRFARNPFVTGEIADVRFYASTPLRTPHGLPIGSLCVFDDEVRELAEHETRTLALLAEQVVDVLELRRLTRELRRSNEQLAQFAGQVSHDLRNPLTALSGYLELAADSPELAAAPHASAALARAESAADRMAALVEDLLDFARIGGSARREPVSLADAARAAVADLEAQLAATGAVVDLGELPVVEGDATLLCALLQNLLANAVKFASADGRAPRVEVRAARIPGAWRITVDDDGPGVPLEERERVFGLMQRGDRADPRVAGLGIGLSTCRRIVQAHGGRIGIEEARLGGASVWVLLPTDD
ncbi:GAF domain-containing sensor histidine kinase [Agrococcus sp. HG114]|uniref:GAF domain-containing sensor histidine kinase n=1 Tax=Agrococcus sp. HG114 TaxID=2969757 RepID=UPI00215A380E|nr:GAF domain-containing sensor histidine kinase [Agrococcus sp. HG114]MCR8671337.1 GAF domain-containing sensor histidine kinase [Agrococcus sp. HG114]